MKNLLAVLILSATLPLYLAAQNPDTLLYERFENGGASFQLNTSDLGGAVGTAGVNGWTINNAYAGGSGQIVCLGFPFTFTIPNTSAQPPAITGGANSYYMHIMSDAGQASGILNSNFIAADGICTLDETNFARMTQDVSTVGFDSATVSFLWLCGGGTSIHGEVYYSINQGFMWNLITTPVSQYKNQSSWAAQSITLPFFAGQSTLRFGFRFVNQNSGVATDPGFGIDEFLITAKNAAAPPVAAFSVSDSSICAGDCVDFTDLSTGNPTSWFWVFQGASTSFSTQQNPSQICFANPGTYTVTLIATSASGSDTLTVNAVTVNTNPSAPAITFSGDTLFATPGFVMYQWFLNDTLLPGAVNDSYITLVDGSYSVSVTDSNGCSAISDTLNYTTGILSAENNFPSLIYPNPANELLYIDTAVELLEIKLINVIGEVVVEKNVAGESNVQLNISALPSGIYFLEMSAANSRSLVKIIKE